MGHFIRSARRISVACNLIKRPVDDLTMKQIGRIYAAISITLLVVASTPLKSTGKVQRKQTRTNRVGEIRDQIRREERRKESREERGKESREETARWHDPSSTVRRCCCGGPQAGAYIWDYGEPFGLGGMWGPGYGLGGGYGAPEPWDYTGTFGGWNGWTYSKEPLAIPPEQDGGEGWQCKCGKLLMLS